MSLSELTAPAATAAGAPTLTTARLAGLGHCLPERVVPNSEISERIGVDPTWIERRTGISERRRAGPGESLAGISARAAGEALSQAGVDPADVDLVILATVTPDHITPAGAPLIATAIGAANAGAFDLGAACAGFVSGLAVGAGMIESGRARTVVVIGAEVMSRVVDYDDRKTAGLFGDGAGAAVLGTGSGAAIGTTRMGSDGSRFEMIVADRERRLVEMDGHATFGAAVVTLSDLTLELCAAESLGLDDIDLFIFHQANGRILGSVAERLGADPAKVFDCIGGIGNTSAASVPIALSIAQEQGRLPESGGRVLLAAFGAGLSWSGAILDFTENA